MSDDKRRLTVNVKPRLARIEVLDGLMQPVPNARGVGRLEVDLSPGLYEIRVDNGLGGFQRRIVRIDSEGDPEPLYLLAPISSAAPLPGTLGFNQVHAEAAATLCMPTSMDSPKGSLLVFGRRPVGGSSESLLFEGLRLFKGNSHPIRGFLSEAKRDEDAGWVAWRGDLDPGCYLLRWESGCPDDPVVDQSLWVLGGYVLMVFLELRVTEAGMRAMRDGIAVLQAPLHTGFAWRDPQAVDNLVAMEVALAGFRDRTRYLREADIELDILLDKKYENPLLGIVAAHCLWLAETPNTSLLKRLHAHLMRTPDHPDVQALTAHASLRGLWGASAPPTPRMSWPPMLAASYRVAIECDWQTNAVLAPHSLASTASPRLLSSEVWSRWASAARPSRKEPTARMVLQSAPNEKSRTVAPEFLGVWLADAVRSFPQLRYLAEELRHLISLDESTAAPRIWNTFAVSRNSVVRRMAKHVAVLFRSLWDRESLGGLRTLTLKAVAKSLRLTEDIVVPAVQDALWPLVDVWPPRRAMEYLNSGPVQDLLANAVKSAGEDFGRSVKLTDAFLVLRTWILSRPAEEWLTSEEFPDRSGFVDFVAAAASQAVRMAATEVDFNQMSSAGDVPLALPPRHIQAIQKALEGLPREQRLVIDELLFHDRPLRRTAKMMKLSDEEVVTLYASALRALPDVP